MKENIKKAISIESFVFIVIFVGVFGVIGRIMGGINLINTIINTSFDLLINTALYLLSVAVIAGALSEILTEFGVVSLANHGLSPIMEPVFGLPGASAIAVLTTYLSDNPAILAFANNKEIRKYFKRYQLPAVTNIGTAFGMGLIVTAAVAGMAPEGESFLGAVAVGNVAAVIGGLISTRLMLYFSAKKYGKTATFDDSIDTGYDILKYRKVRPGGVSSRLLSAALEGGRHGMDLVIDIIPGILIITTTVLILTNGTGEVGVYDGSAYQGVGLLPYLGSKIEFILKPLFGFSHVENIAVPLTALGAAGASLGIIKDLVGRGLANSHDVAVFVAMCMCFSGYLTTHVVMMESIGEKELIRPALLSHTVGGLCAGIVANLLYTWIF